MMTFCENTIDILEALEKLDNIIASSVSSDLEKDLAEALKYSLYHINNTTGDKSDAR